MALTKTDLNQIKGLLKDQTKELNQSLKEGLRAQNEYTSKLFSDFSDRL